MSFFFFFRTTFSHSDWFIIQIGDSILPCLRVAFWGSVLAHSRAEFDTLLSRGGCAGNCRISSSSASCLPSVVESKVRGGKTSFPEEKKMEMPLSAGSFSTVLQAHSCQWCGVKGETVLCCWGVEGGWILTGIHYSWKMGKYLCVVFKEFD